MPTRESELANIAAEFILTEGHPEKLYQRTKNYEPKSNSKKEEFGYMEINRETGEQIFRAYPGGKK